MDFLYIQKCKPEVEKLFLREKISNFACNEKIFSIICKAKVLNFYTGQPNALFIGKQRDVRPINRIKPYCGYIKNINLVDSDRILKWHIVRILPNGNYQNNYLILELTGKNANVFILNDKSTIIFAFRAIKSGIRNLSEGSIYREPPNEKKSFNEIKFGTVTQLGIERKLYKFLKGISPLNSREIGVLFEESGSLKKAYESFIQRNINSKCAYMYYENGKPRYITTFAYESLSGLEHQTFCGDNPFLRCWKEFYVETTEKQAIQKLKSKVLKPLIERETKLRKKCDEVKNIAGTLDKAERLRKIAELLKYNLDKAKGKRSIKVKDYETGRDITINLDSSVSPSRNVEKLFTRYKKLKRKAEFLRKLSKDLKIELERVRALRKAIESSNDVSWLKGLVSNPKQKLKVKKNFKTFTLSSGKKVIVGKSSKENELLWRSSNPWDIWLHVKDIPGSHVILKLGKNELPDKADITQAAALAAHFSKARNDTKALVSFTKVKNLSKPPNTPAGFVTFKNEKVICVKPALPSPFTHYIKNGNE